MSDLVAGLLFSEETLTSPWFILLATVVAFNTIIYVGLTLGKLIPWPRQFHPSTVRRWLGLLGVQTDPEAAAQAIPGPRQPESLDPYEDMRMGIARNDLPQAFALTGGLSILLALAGVLSSGTHDLRPHVVELCVGVVFLGLAAVLGRRYVRGRVLMWTWALACTGLVALIAVEAIGKDELVPLAYALLVMTAFPAPTLAWRPTIVASVMMLGWLLGAVFAVAEEESLRVGTAGVLALLLGAILLHLRLAALESLSDEKARSAAMAATDPLTGVLTRHGLLTLMPGLAGTAERAGSEVCVMFFDIEHLTTANQQYGIHYGDDVLRIVAQGIQQHVRIGDLVSRWGGDEFLVVGIGSKPDATALAARIENSVRESGVNLGKWPTTVRSGTAAGDPAQTVFDRLVAAAELEAAGVALPAQKETDPRSLGQAAPEAEAQTR